MLSKLLRTDDWIEGLPTPPLDELCVWPRVRLCIDGGGALTVLVALGGRSSNAGLMTVSDQPYSMFETPPDKGSLLRRADQ